MSTETSYSTHADMVELFAALETYSTNTSRVRKLAYAWVNDAISNFLTTPLSGSDLTETAKLAEANYAIYLVLRANSNEDYFRYLDDARNNVRLLRLKESNTIESNTESNAVFQRFNRGKRDDDGVYLGPGSGHWGDDIPSNLDKW